MTIYRIWVVALGGPQGPRIIYTRHFPHLERRDCFIFPSISPMEFLRSVFASLGIEFSFSAGAAVGGTSMYSSSATISAVPHHESSFDTSSNRMTMSTGGSSSHGSSSSLNSVVSTATTSTRGPFSSDHHQTSFATDSMSTITTNTFSALYNYLPLIVCRFMNSPREIGNSELEFQQQKLAYVDLLLLVFEKNGHLFLALPRLTSGHNLNFSPGGVTTVENISSYYEQLLLEELNISLAYSALQLLSTSFFAGGKSVKQLEVVVSSCLPFGTLIKDGAELRSLITSSPLASSSDVTKNSNREDGESAVLKLVINEFISTSFQSTSTSTSLQLSRDQGETLFGTLTVEPRILSKQLARAELKMSVDNLTAFSVAKPPNCDTSPSSLIFDLKHTKLEPFNTLHFKLKGDEDSSASPGGDRRKLFTYRYRIAPRSSTIQHISLAINFAASSRLQDAPELKFALFVVKFSFKNSSGKQPQGKTDQGSVQTADSSSVVNRIVRESIRASFGQVRNEAQHSTFSWIIGQRLPKSGALSLEFDLLADEAKLANLETLCTFRIDHKLATKMAYTKKRSADADIEEVRECSLRQLLSKVISEPCFAIGKLVLTTEQAVATDGQLMHQRGSSRQQSNSKGGASGNQLVTIEYRLTSFEYRLLPEFSTRTLSSRSSDLSVVDHPLQW